jgi:hypothetical protein
MNARWLVGAAGILIGSGVAASAEKAPLVRASDAGAMLTCGDPVAWDATEDSLKAVFGAANLEFKDLGGAEGEEMPGTLLNGGDPKRRLEIVWADEAARAKPSMLRLFSGFDETTGSEVVPVWTMPSGLRIGLTLAEVEALNGKPFRLSGFGWDYGGMVLDWQGGKLDAGSDTCHVGVMFNPRGDYGEKITGDVGLMSDDTELRASDPVVLMMTLSYVRPD